MAKMTWQVYRTGGDELAVICIRKASATVEGFNDQVRCVVVDVAGRCVHIAKGKEQDGQPMTEVSTFLRIGVGPTFKLADDAEVAVRSAIYLRVFGSLDARGQTASKGDIDAAGISNWKIHESTAQDDEHGDEVTAPAPPADAENVEGARPPAALANEQEPAALRMDEVSSFVGDHL